MGPNPTAPTEYVPERSKGVVRKITIHGFESHPGYNAKSTIKVFDYGFKKRKEPAKEDAHMRYHIHDWTGVLVPVPLRRLDCLWAQSRVGNIPVLSGRLPGPDYRYRPGDGVISVC